MEGLLPIHEREKDDSMIPMREAIVEKFEETKSHVHEKYGTKYQETFQVCVHKIKYILKKYLTVLQEPTLNRLLLEELNH